MWRDTARRQAGVVARRQLRAGGLTDRQIDTVVRRGALRRAGPQGIFAVAGSPSTAEAVLWTAVLATRGVVSHLSAARIWDLPVPENAGIHVTVNQKFGALAAHGVVTHRVPLATRAVTERFGLPITSRARTVLDCLGVLPAPGARLLLDRALQVRAVTTGDLQRRLSAEPSRLGNVQIRTLCGELTDAAAESERLLHRLLAEAGVGDWQANLRVRIDGQIFEIDVAFRESLLAIEVDGWAHHSDVSRFRADRRKQNALIMAGWTVIRFTWSDLVERPGYVIRTICVLLSSDRGRLSTVCVED